MKHPLLALLFLVAAANSRPVSAADERVLSPDGSVAAYLRVAPAGSAEIWLADARGGAERRVTLPPRGYGALTVSRFSLDGAKLFFMGAAGTKTSKILVADVASGKSRFFCVGRLTDIVPEGRYKGALVVEQRRKSRGGFYDWYWLYAPNGRELGPLGEIADARKRVVSR